MNPIELARRFHETYERLAPDHGYQTRTESAVPWDDVPDNNQELMIAVAAELLPEIEQQVIADTIGWTAKVPDERLRAVRLSCDHVKVSICAVPEVVGLTVGCRVCCSLETVVREIARGEA